MEQLYKMKDRLIKEIGNYADAQISGSVLELLDHASTTAKNICKIIEHCEESEAEYSGGSYAYDDGGSYGMNSGRSYRMSGANSYARGRRRAPRDSMGRYSGNNYSRHSGQEIAEEIRGLMQGAPDEETRRELDRVAKLLEQR